MHVRLNKPVELTQGAGCESVLSCLSMLTGCADSERRCSVLNVLCGSLTWHVGHVGQLNLSRVRSHDGCITGSCDKPFFLSCSLGIDFHFVAFRFGLTKSAVLQTV